MVQAVRSDAVCVRAARTDVEIRTRNASKKSLQVHTSVSQCTDTAPVLHDLVSCERRHSYGAGMSQSKAA